LSSIVAYSNCRTGLGPCSNPCSSKIFPPFLRACSAHLFSQGPSSLPGPDRVDPVGSLKPGPAPQKFHFGPDFETTPGLIIYGHHHDTWPRCGHARPGKHHVATRLPVIPTARTRGGHVDHPTGPALTCVSHDSPLARTHTRGQRGPTSPVDPCWHI
jgi:hypothetical protein